MANGGGSLAWGEPWDTVRCDRCAYAPRATRQACPICDGAGWILAPAGPNVRWTALRLKIGTLP